MMIINSFELMTITSHRIGYINKNNNKMYKTNSGLFPLASNHHNLNEPNKKHN